MAEITAQQKIAKSGETGFGALLMFWGSKLFLEGDTNAKALGAFVFFVGWAIVYFGISY